MTQHSKGTAHHVTVVGGGLSGAAIAYHLARQVDPTLVQITVIEPRAELGQGLAYSTPDPDHRLNVPDHKMSLSVDDPEDFHRWLHSPEGPVLPGASATLRGEIFAPRHVFASYVAARLRPYLASGQIRHLQDTATGAEELADGRLVLRTEGGARIFADQLVLSITHPAPRLPAEIARLAGHRTLIADAYAPGALDGIAPTDRVLVLGSGLTGADVVATLVQRGHLARIDLLSRHGRFSAPHGPVQAETSGDFAKAPEKTALELLRRVRAVLQADAAAGLTWHAAFDRLRAQGPAIWAALPQPERRRFLRHLRGLWDVHRFRIAPQTHDILQKSIAARRVLPVAGQITIAQANGRKATLQIRLRKSQELLTVEVDRIILATGPSHSDAIRQSPFLTALAGLGLIAPDPLGLGLATAPTGAARHIDGTADERILIGGPLARGTVGELMGVPEVTSWAARLATELLGRVPVAATTVAAG
ncbi:FAD/NAD(P)-binding protein [Fuscibacter oryzae]|uniref:FAD-dependent oxidoreductase n=1 Tax=Fuscibacter oryzae TaxID=2803939 RepID=A0A8J7MQU4_9RHOB|nr:FAD/NAD(P)-binding protein [Fuscibacter oryzae]MBL4926663.1 FAD-dependent oxidoreductase [Fuscibacter oryzae]